MKEKHTLESIVMAAIILAGTIFLVLLLLYSLASNRAALLADAPPAKNTIAYLDDIEIYELQGIAYWRPHDPSH